MKLMAKLTGEVTVEHIPSKQMEYQGLYDIVMDLIHWYKNGHYGAAWNFIVITGTL